MKVTPAPDFAMWKQAHKELRAPVPPPAGWITRKDASMIFGVRETQAGKNLRQLVAVGKAEVKPWKVRQQIIHIYRLKK